MWSYEVKDIFKWLLNKSWGEAITNSKFYLVNYKQKHIETQRQYIISNCKIGTIYA